jgi:hypothetical protein
MEATMTFPSDLPVMIFTTKDKKGKEGKSKITFYRDQLDNGAENKLISFEGHHYLHWSSSKEMSEAVNEFIKNKVRN